MGWWTARHECVGGQGTPMFVEGYAATGDRGPCLWIIYQPRLPISGISDKDALLAGGSILCRRSAGT